METKVSFVILSFNDANMVINAVKSIKNLKTRCKYDIFVVDNGSKDNTPKIIKDKFRDIKVIELKENIGTAAYDKAIKKTKSKYIYFTGCDIEVKEDMLDKLVDFLEKNENAVQAAPKYINLYDKKKIDLAGTWLSRSFYSGTFKNNALGSENVEIPYIGTGLIRKSFIEKFGYLFDNDYFFYGEDVALGLRIRLLGYKVYYIPSSVVYHAGSVSRKIHKPSFLTYLMERNLLRTFFSSLSLGSIVLILPYVLTMRIAGILKDVLTLRLMDAFARIRAILWIVFNFPLIIKKRMRVQNIRKAEDKALFKYFTEKYLLKKFYSF